MVGFDPNERELSRYTHVAAGALSGIFTRTLSQPLDVLKIRFQVGNHCFEMAVRK